MTSEVFKSNDVLSIIKELNSMLLLPIRLETLIGTIIIFFKLKVSFFSEKL